jgi:hypothetical protein
MNFYGLGEREGNYKLNTGTYTLFSKDSGADLGPSDGTPPGGK